MVYKQFYLCLRILGQLLVMGAFIFQNVTHKTKPLGIASTFNRYTELLLPRILSMMLQCYS